MRFPAFAYPRAEMHARVIARLEAGMSMTTLQREPGYPSRETLRCWGQADPAFARQMAAARAWGQGERRYAKAGPVFDPAWADAFLLQVRRGETVADLARRPDWPSRRLVSRWRREQPDFDRALAASVRFARDLRGPRKPFDQVLADRIIVRVSRGETLADLSKDPTMPGWLALERWRKRRPDFAAALKIAHQFGHRHRMRVRSKCTPKLTKAIAEHILAGGSMTSASQTVRGAPNRVTLWKWMRARPDFARDIELALRMRDEQMLDQAVMIAEDITHISRHGNAADPATGGALEFS